MLSCKQTIELSSKNLDASLSWYQRLGMRLHLMVCHNCRRYIKQLRFLQKVMTTMDEQHSDIHLTSQAKKRIRSNILKSTRNSSK